MVDIKHHIKEHLAVIVSGITQEKVDLTISFPSNPMHGDYFTNVALQLFHKVKDSDIAGNPLELAEYIKAKYQELEDSTVARIDVVKPGFINFWLSESAISRQLSEVLDKKQIELPTKTKNGQKVMIEFTDPNPFKEFHIGHLYSNIVGESLSRLFEAEGAGVWRVNYQGDVGMHVAKALYGLSLVIADYDPPSTREVKIMDEAGPQSSRGKWNEILKRVQDDTIENKVKLLGEAYAKGAAAYEEDPLAAEEMREINKKVFAKDPEIFPLYETGRAWSMEYFETIYARLGTTFDRYYPESEVGPVGSKLVKEYQKEGVFEESDGAIIFPGKKYGLHNRVFINSLGLPTYEAKELGLAPTKYKDYPYDLSVIVTGNEIDEYFKVLLKALEQIHPDLAAKTKHISHGMVRLPEGKMSSRKGNVLTGEWLLDEAKRHIQERFPQMDERTAEIVAVGAVKYSLLKFSVGADIPFSFEESVSLEGNSGPYLQYTFARTQSILAKATDHGLQTTSEASRQWTVDNDEERLLLRKLVQCADTVAIAAEAYAPHLLCVYLFELAQLFNLFYQKHKILEGENSQTRLALTALTGITLRYGLHLLGIKAPERM